MNDQLRDSFWDYREHFRRLMGASWPGQAGEAALDYQADRGPAPLDERLLQTIWAQQLIQTSGLRLAGGEALRIIDPGRWSGGAGPDFKDARIMIDERTMRGDIEIHLRASDWRAHGHERDFNYNSVVLHVVLSIDNGADRDTLHNGNRVARLELEPYIFPDLETLRRSITPDDYQYAQPEGVGRCHWLMTAPDQRRLVADFLDRAGDERLISKMHRLEEQSRQADMEQVFYQAVLMALGTGPGKTLYYLLAKRAPLAEVVDYARELPRERRALGLESLLLNVAGLAPGEADLTDAPAEARERVAQLAELWRRFEPYWSDRLIPPTRRWYQGVRPVNFPVRRLAGVAEILARAIEVDRLPLADLSGRIQAGRASLEGALPTRRRHPLIMDLVQWFRVPGEGRFWGGHYSFTARPAGRVMDLIGEGAALSLMFNALLPAALLAARQNKCETLGTAVERLFGLVPPLQPNHITQFMTRRLFGDDDRADQLINTERRRQGLFQIFYHCCRGEERHCESCYFRTATDPAPHPH